MKKTCIIISIIVVFVFISHAQEKVDNKINDLYKLYQNGEFENLIKKSLLLKDKFDDSSINRHYVLYFLGLGYTNSNEKYNANIEFLNLLGVNPQFEPDLFTIKTEDKEYFESFKTFNLGSIHIYSEPSLADIYINDELQGKTPLQIEKILSGTINIKIIKPGYDIYEEDVLIEPGESVKINVHLNFTISSSSLTISSVPPGALVYLDTNFVGLSPVQLTTIKSGFYKLTLFKDGYKSHQETLLKTNKTKFKEITLTKEKDYFFYSIIVPGLSQFIKGYKTHGILSVSAFLGSLYYYKKKLPETPPKYNHELQKRVLSATPPAFDYYIDGEKVTSEEYKKEESNKILNEDEWRKYDENKWQLKALGYTGYLFNIIDAIIVLKYDQKKKRKEDLLKLGLKGDSDEVMMTIKFYF